MLKERIYNGRIIKLEDVPAYFYKRGNYKDILKSYINKLNGNKLYMRDYISNPNNQIKIKEKRKREWQAIKSNSILMEQNRKSKRDWYRNNPDKAKIIRDKSRAKPGYKATQRIYKQKYYQNNQIEWRIRSFLRHIKLNYSIVKTKTWDKYGIDVYKIKESLKKSAEEYGGYDKIRHDYHIDHIIPIKMYDIKNCKEDIINCNNVSNLRWLSANENISKGAKLRPQDIKIIKTLPKEIYPKSWNGIIPKE